MKHNRTAFIFSLPFLFALPSCTNSHQLISKDMSQKDIDRAIGILTGGRTLLNAKISNTKEMPNFYFQTSSFNTDKVSIDKSSRISDHIIKSENNTFTNKNDITKWENSILISEDGNVISEEKNEEEIVEDYLSFRKRFEIDNSFISEFCKHIKRGVFVNYSSKWSLNSSKLFLEEGTTITINLFDEVFKFSNIDYVYAYIGESKRGSNSGPTTFTDLEINGLVNQSPYKAEFRIHYSENY